jgi:hypothetical protein
MKTYIRLEETTHKANFFEQGAAEKKKGRRRTYMGPAEVL